MKPIIKSLPVLAGLLFVMAAPSNAQFLRASLNGFTPDETTFETFEKNLKDRGCQYEAKDNLITVKQGCFQLPGDPQITASPGFGGKPGIVGQVVINFSNDDNKNYQLYFNKLQDKYGKPTYFNQGLDTVVATWRFPAQCYILTANFDHGTGSLFDGSYEAFKHELQEKFPAAYQLLDLDEL